MLSKVSPIDFKYRCTYQYLILISNSSEEVPDDKVDGDGDEEQLLEASLHQGATHCREESEDRVDPA